MPSAWSCCSYSSHFWHFYMWSVRLYDSVNPNRICLVQINKQKSHIPIVLVRTVLGMHRRTSRFWSFASRALVYWCTLSIWSPKVLFLMFYTMLNAQTGWIIYYKALRVNYYASLTVLSSWSNIAQTANDSSLVVSSHSCPFLSDYHGSSGCSWRCSAAIRDWHLKLLSGCRRWRPNWQKRRESSL